MTDMEVVSKLTT